MPNFTPLTPANIPSLFDHSSLSETEMNAMLEPLFRDILASSHSEKATSHPLGLIIPDGWCYIPHLYLRDVVGHDDAADNIMIPKEQENHPWGQVVDGVGKNDWVRYDTDMTYDPETPWLVRKYSLLHGNIMMIPDIHNRWPEVIRLNSRYWKVTGTHSKKSRKVKHRAIKSIARLMRQQPSITGVMIDDHYLSVADLEKMISLPSGEQGDFGEYHDGSEFDLSHLPLPVYSETGRLRGFSTQRVTSRYPFLSEAMKNLELDMRDIKKVSGGREVSGHFLSYSFFKKLSEYFQQLDRYSETTQTPENSIFYTDPYGVVFLHNIPFYRSEIERIGNGDDPNAEISREDFLEVFLKKNQ